MRRFVRTALGLILVLAPAAFAQEAESGSKASASAASVESPGPDGAIIRFPGEGEELGGFLATPEGAGPYPTVVLIHEWWGLNDWVKDNARKLARLGYVALAVDLYRGRVADDRELAHELMRGLPRGRAVGDMRAAVDYLRGRPDVDSARIGAIGWCMGGGYSLALAMAEPIRAAVVCYGRPVVEPDPLRSIEGAVLGIFGADDRGIPASDVKSFQGALNKAGVSATISLYEDVGHAFMNPGNERGYSPQASERAWDEILAFLEQQLETPVTP